MLDCTLRDGGNLNQWMFTSEEINLLIHQLDHAGVEIIEIGYRGGSGSNRSTQVGSVAKCDAEFILSLPQELRYSQYAVMVIPEVCTLRQLEDLRDSCVAWIRVAAYPQHVQKALTYVSVLKDWGFKVCFNLMSASYIEAGKLAMIAQEAEHAGADVFYFADSYGAFHPDDITAIVNALKNKTELPLGFHGHNNLGLSFANALRALDLGVSYIDTSICGMARGAGNLATEQFAAVMNKWKRYEGEYELAPILQLSAYFLEKVLTVPMTIAQPEIICGLNNLHYYYYQHIERVSKTKGLDPMYLGYRIGQLMPLEVDADFVEKIGDIIQTEQGSPIPKK
ncbi:aldolase [Paenibacillus illinoisensis]|uniref:aldolase n=1 Tax=Paenibacillus illinoisensis TaxID=59845 RepID=UPI0027D94142|nr:aldolase [Paenibacillus illinoisensis]